MKKKAYKMGVRWQNISGLFAILFALILVGGCRKSLHEAVRLQEFKTVKQLINGGANVNARNEDGETPLHIAALVDRADIAALLIASGADINASDEYGWTPLHQAAMNSHWGVRVGELLISKGADIHRVTNDGYAPLHAAARGGNAGLVRLLIEKGADVNAQAKSGDTPLHWAAQACRYDQNETVEALLSAGAKVLVKNKVGFTPLESALTWDNQVIADLLVKALDLDRRGKYGGSLLHWAARRHNPELVRLFIEHGGDINAKDGQGNTPLDVAVLIHNEDIVKLLESKGAKKTQKEEPATVPVISQEELMLYVKRVISEGGDVNAPHELGVPPLHIAAIYGYTDVADFLLSKGVSPNSVDNQGRTALHNAALSSQLEIGKLLIEHDASVNAVTKDGWTPLHFAVLANEGSIEFGKLLISSGAELNIPGPLGGQTPLHMSVMYRNIPLTKLLLAEGADDNVRNLEGRTPLQEAAKMGHKEIVELLIQK